MEMTHRRRALLVALGLVALLLSFGVGRWSAPTRIQERERLVERTTEARSSSDRQGSSASASTAQVAADDREVIRRIRVVVASDGTQEREEVTEERAARRTEARAEQTRVEYRDRVQVVVQEKWKDRIVERVTETGSQRPWRAGLLGGADITRSALVGAYAGRALGPLDIQVSVIVPSGRLEGTAVLAGVGWRW